MNAIQCNVKGRIGMITLNIDVIGSECAVVALPNNINISGSVGTTDGVVIRILAAVDYVQLVKAPEAFGERSRDWSLGHAGDEGPHLSMTGEISGLLSSGGPVCGFS